MKVIAVQYEDTVDISSLPIGTVVSLSDGTTTLANGKVLFASGIYEPSPQVLPHTHLADTSIGPPQP